MTHTHLLLPLIATSVIGFLTSCDEAAKPLQARDHQARKPPPQAQPLPDDPLSANPLEALAKTVSTGTPRDASLALRELTRQRTEEACTLMIKLLHAEAALLPEQLPPLDEMKRLEAQYLATRKEPEGDHWAKHFRKAAEAARYLVMLDMPVADRAAKDFRDELSKKWGANELGKILLNTVNTEYSQAERDVQTGVVPWKDAKR